VEFVGIDWATRRAAWCAVDAAGRRLGEGAVVADESGLLRLVAERGLEVTAAVEMMSGAAWVAETLRSVGWTVRVADARRARALAPLAAKTDRIDARVLAELARAASWCLRSGFPRSATARCSSSCCVGCT
jgi:transposase